MENESENKDIDLSKNNENAAGEDNSEEVKGGDEVEGGDEEENTPPEKPQETPEAKLARLERQAKQLRKKLGVDEPETKSKKSKKSEDLDYGQLAYLSAKGIESDEDIDFVKEVMVETGKDLKDVIKSKYFQAELKDRKEAAIVREAIPSSSKRSGTSTKDTVEHWLAKGQLPPPEQTELRRKVVNARIQKESSGSRFTSSPIVGKF